MKLLTPLFFLLLLPSCASQKSDTGFDDQQTIYKSWILSRCLSKALSNEASKQDALNSASAYLEASNLPVEAFTDAEPLINEFVTKNYQGSIAGTFNTKKCIDLLYSQELEELINDLTINNSNYHN